METTPYTHEKRGALEQQLLHTRERARKGRTILGPRTQHQQWARRCLSAEWSYSLYCILSNSNTSCDIPSQSAIHSGIIVPDEDCGSRARHSVSTPGAYPNCETLSIRFLIESDLEMLNNLDHLSRSPFFKCDCIIHPRHTEEDERRGRRRGPETRPRTVLARMMLSQAEHDALNGGVQPVLERTAQSQKVHIAGRQTETAAPGEHTHSKT